MSEKGKVGNIVKVQVDGLVALKIIKHCQEEGSSTEMINGFLVGLVVKDTVEITDCFPVPILEEDTESYQMDMLRNLRKVNVDYHTVGWYQSTYLHSHINKEFLENHRKYQEVNEESIVLVYDPLRTTQGILSLRAFRLTPIILDMLLKNFNFTPESVQGSELYHMDLFEELPVFVHNSRLQNVLLCELEQKMMMTTANSYDHLSLATNNILVCNMQLLMSGVDLLYQDTNRLVSYEKNIAKQMQMKQQFIQKRHEENLRRKARGEPPLPDPEEVVDKELNLKPPVAPPRLDGLLLKQQVESHCDQAHKFASQGISKLYLAESFQR